MMDLDALADWVAIGGTFALGSAFIGIGLGRIFALMDRVARLEAFAEDVCRELHSRSDSVGAEAL
ncbi:MULTISPECIES: hypothetical protein [Nocardia]|uniref:hypothetical protein n=1 Tax=Nocardia TaxID=1817 RepID=UPI0012D7F7A5|nr:MULTISPECIES: hypothetical protein [Nocardia]MBF6272164.1 hypothetical protein [Nocardia nova]